MGSKKLGMWLFIVSDTLTFSALLVTYTYSRIMNPDWPKPFPMNPAIIFSTAMTVVLLFSSLTMVMAVMASQRDDRAATVKWMIATMICGLTFMGLHLREWFHLIEEGATITHNPWGTPLFGAVFFGVTGMHMTHVLIGVIYLGIVAAGYGRGKFSSGRCRSQRTLLALCRPGLDVRVSTDLSDVREILVAVVFVGRGFSRDIQRPEKQGL